MVHCSQACILFVVICIYHFATSLDAESSTSYNPNSKEFGFVVCSGGGDMFNELIALLLQFKSKHGIWEGSNLPITITHCDEIAQEKQSILKLFFQNISFMDVCSSNALNVRREKLKGFFCKPMALMHSPYVNTAIIDTDVIWLQDPIVLFQSRGYQDSGTLFFRDRWTQTKNRLTLTAGRHHARELHDYLKSVSTHLREMFGSTKFADGEGSQLDNVTALAHNNPYWNHLAKGLGRSLDHWQDSSVVLLHSKKAERILQAIRAMLKDYNIGYGDKEIYWLAATASNEKFAFEPYEPGSLGDCGALVHFDPSVRDTAKKPRPLYINAEYLIDLSKIKTVGDFLDIDGPKLLISEPRLMESHKIIVDYLSNWKNMKHGFYPCGACNLYTCAPAEEYIIKEYQGSFEFFVNLEGRP